MIGLDNCDEKKILQRYDYVCRVNISQSVLLLEAPSFSSKKSAENDERSKQSAGNIMTTQEMEMIKSVKKNESNMHDTAATVTSYRVKQKAKEPNPLSCKKRKTQETHAMKPIDRAIIPPRKRKRSKKAISMDHLTK